jgi:dihydrofolate reductase
MKAILACEKNGGIGYKGSMPWPKQEKDLARFKELTLNKTILMGRGTWESTGMPKPLPNRKNIVFSQQNLNLPDGVEQRELFDKIDDVDWVIGGAKMIELVWDYIDEFHLSHIRSEYECDTHLDLTRLREDFILTRSQICLTHNYEIWKRKE